MIMPEAGYKTVKTGRISVRSRKRCAPASAPPIRSGLARDAASESRCRILRIGSRPVIVTREDRRGTMAAIGDKNDGLVVLGEALLVIETPESLLDDDTTPTDKFYVRNNGLVPQPARNAETWTVTVDGEVTQPMALSLSELKARFESVTLRMVVECGGNGRSFFDPPAPGVQWTNGGVGCCEWTGVRVADVLKAAGLKSSASFSGHFRCRPACHLQDGPAIDVARRSDCQA